MAAVRFLGIVVALASGGGMYSQQAPQLIYGTYLGGRNKECATGLAVDRSGTAFVVGRTPSPDFPITRGAFSTTTLVNNDDWVGFVSRISNTGDRLLYSSFIGGNFRASANAVAVDDAGRAFVAGSTCSSSFPATPSAILKNAPGSSKVDACDGFVAWVTPDGSRLEYATYLGGREEDAATAIALAPHGEVVYIGGYTLSPDFPITRAALQSRLNGSSNGFLSAIDVRSGKLLYSSYLGGDGVTRVTSIAAALDGTVYVSGVTNSKSWPQTSFTRFGNLGASDGFVVRIDPTGKIRPSGMRIGGSSDDTLTSISVDSSGNIYAVGATSSPTFPVKGKYLRQAGSAFVVKIDGVRFARGHPEVLWSRRFGGGDDFLSSVAAGMPGSVFISGRSGSKDFPTTAGAFYRTLSVENDSILARLRSSDGRLQYSTFIGGTRQPNASWYNDEATGVYADAQGDVSVTGCTLDNRLPVSLNAFQPKPKGNSEPFVLRLRFPVSRTESARKPLRH